MCLPTLAKTVDLKIVAKKERGSTKAKSQGQGKARHHSAT